MVRKIEVETNWGVEFLGFDSRPMTIKTFLKGVLGFSNILDVAYPARNEIYNIRCSASNIPFCLVGGSIACERFRLMDVVLAHYTSRGALKSAMLDGGRRNNVSRWDLGPDNQVSKVAGTSVCHDGFFRDGPEETI